VCVVSENNKVRLSKISTWYVNKEPVPEGAKETERKPTIKRPIVEEPMASIEKAPWGRSTRRRSDS
jgi:hypothetical protein